MPTFDFNCKDCNHVFEELCNTDPTETYPEVTCPHCKSKNKEKLLNSCNFTFAQPEGTDRWNKSHDYRFYHKQPGIRKERENAVAKSHMGSKPYNDINDLTSDKPFDFGKI